MICHKIDHWTKKVISQLKWHSNTENRWTIDFLQSGIQVHVDCRVYVHKICVTHIIILVHLHLILILYNKTLHHKLK